MFIVLHRQLAHRLQTNRKRALSDLIDCYCAKTSRSKKLAQQWRPFVADNRTIVGFDRTWKEMVYQIVSTRSSGSRIWDVDGNEYVDTALCLGANLLGHSPECVVNAIQDQLSRGYEVAVQNYLLGEVSEKVCRMTQNERLTYCHSGSEAIETAIRVARASTGRDRIAYFTRDIHGRTDVVLGRPVNVNGRQRTLPQVAGIPQQVLDHAVVLEYGTPEAIEAIREQASKLALVLVEPVRTRNPDLQPVDFLKELRRLADAEGFLLVFDEIVTGFRAHQGGVQALFNVKADLTTYGKVLGGGLPIGVLAGKAEFIDLIDGGQWRFGDDSYPEADITASGGTMIKHPLSLAAANAIVKHLETEGPDLQEKLNQKAATVATELNIFYQAAGLPVHIEQFSSFFRPTFTGNRKFEGLFQYYLRMEGIHTNPPSPSFLSTAHTAEDLETIIRAYKRAAKSMAEAGFFEELLPPSAATYSGNRKEQSKDHSEHHVPMLPNIFRFLVERDTPDAHHWNLAVLLQSSDPLRSTMLAAALRHLIARHDALRLRFRKSEEGWYAILVNEPGEVPFSFHDLSQTPVDQRSTELLQISEKLQASLDLADGPLLRVAHFDLGSAGHRLLVIIHHFVMDGLSWRPFWEDFQTAYEQLCRNEKVIFQVSSSSFEQWAVALNKFAKSQPINAETEHWLALPWQQVKPLPLDHQATNGSNTNQSARQIRIELTVEETKKFLGVSDVPQKVDLLYTALAGSLGEWTNSDTVLFEVMGHGREEELFEDLDLFGTVGFFISYTPLVLQLPSNSRDTALCRLLSDQIHQILRKGLTFDLLRFLSAEVKTQDVLRKLPCAEVMFNYMGQRKRLDIEPTGSTLSLAHESTGLTHSPRGVRYYPLAISSEIWKDRLRFNFVYSENLHRPETIERFAGRYRTILLELVEAAQKAKKMPASV
jgi:non-ribosomal peptide synthase protein (TIGR01720 family)